MKRCLDVLRRKMAPRERRNKDNVPILSDVNKNSDEKKTKKTEKKKDRPANLKKIKLANRSTIHNCANVNMTLQNGKLNEVRSYYLNNSNHFVNADGLKCNILSAVHCNEHNILFYLLVFSFTNINNDFLELMKIHIINEKTEETVTKNVPFIVANMTDHANATFRIFSNVKIAMKIQENKKLSQYANENTSIQDITLDNIFYIIEYRRWNDSPECIQNSSSSARISTHCGTVRR
ncbi:conserved Plasmodium protein, unknown function [Plasmodium ovale]|nr:conserved Plasmodium protein, unknown function [Plasmodium ovale]